MPSHTSTEGFDFDTFVREHPWMFSATVAALLALFALVNGGSAVGAFVGFFLVTALLTLAYGRLTDAGASGRADGETGRRGRADRRGSAAADENEDRALARLRERYAEGAIDDEEFERRLERLLLTEDEASARAELDIERET